MPKFSFKRLEKYKTGGTSNNIQISIPFPKTDSGKVYRWCPNKSCIPRLFLLGEINKSKNFDEKKLRRTPGNNGTTCPYCGQYSTDESFNYQGDIKAIRDYVAWAVQSDMRDQIKKMTENFNKNQSKNSVLSLNMSVKPSNIKKPRVVREDLLRNLACNRCGREYGVYAIGIYCPDCGSVNFDLHFEREIELIIQQIELAEQIAVSGNFELSYRILGNAHEDVLTAFETYQKIFYKHMVKQEFSIEESKKMLSKTKIGNKFQNIEKAQDLFKKLSIEPYNVLSSNELNKLKFNIDKRHVIGHNLSIADEFYTDSDKPEMPGTTIELIANEIIEFAKVAKKLIIELSKLL